MNRPIAGLLLVVHAAGCSHWTGTDLAPRRVAREDRIRVNLQGGWQAEFHGPFIVGDSLIGFGDGSTGPRRAVALDQVKSIEVRRRSAGRVLLASVGATALLALISAANKRPQTIYVPIGNGGGSGGPGIGVSCPLVYSWDGADWRLDSGTFGGAIVPALARTDLDNLRYATATRGELRLRVANELAEVDHVDALVVVAVDHPAGTEVAPDGRGAIHLLRMPIAPRTAITYDGADARARLLTEDGWGWESRLIRRDTANPETLRDGLDLVFPKPAGARRAHLIVDGRSTPWAGTLMQALLVARGNALPAWSDSLSAMPLFAAGTKSLLARVGFLAAAVRQSGAWAFQGYIEEAGPEVAKRQVLELDLNGVDGDSVQIRLESTPAMWNIDRVAIDYSSDESIITTEARLTRARAADGRDVAALIERADGRFYDLSHGASAEMRFAVAPDRPGLRRSYLLRSTGWYGIDVDPNAVPDLASLKQVGTPAGAARVAIARLNGALDAIGAGAR